MIIVALALLLAGIFGLRLRRDKPVGPSMSQTSRLIGAPAFEVQVEMPAFNSGRAPWEIPGVILGYDHGPHFDQTSPGALIGKIAPDHIELGADGGWDLLIETDEEGKLAQRNTRRISSKTRGQTVEIHLSTRGSDSWLSARHTARGLRRTRRQLRTGSSDLQERCVGENSRVALPTAQGSRELRRGEKARMKDNGGGMRDQKQR